MNICDAVAVRTEHLVRSVAAAVDLLSSTPFEARRGLSGATSVRAGPNDSLLNVCALSKGRRRRHFALARFFVAAWFKKVSPHIYVHTFRCRTTLIPPHMQLEVFSYFCSRQFHALYCHSLRVTTVRLHPRMKPARTGWLLCPDEELEKGIFHV